MIAFKWNTHILITVALLVTTMSYINIRGSIVIVVLLLAFGSLLPDIDHPKSKIGKYLPIGYFMKHRAWYTHSIIGAFLLPLPFLLINKSYYVLVALGCLSHTLADTLTPGGTKIIYPISNKNYSLNIAKTGSKEENSILSLLILYIFVKLK